MAEKTLEGTEEQNTSKTPAYDSLKDKYKAFVDNYFLTNFNGRQSAILAGYKASSAHTQAYRLLNNEYIQKAIQERFDKVDINTQEIVQRLKNIASFDPSKYIETYGTEEEIKEGKARYKFNIQAMVDDGYGFMIKGTNHDRYGKPIFLLKDSEHALDQLVKISGLVQGKGENTTDITITVLDKADYDLL